MAYQLDSTTHFKRSYKLPSDINDQVDKLLRALVKGRPYSASLRVKKMKGHQYVFEASATMDIRVIFH